MLINQNWNNMKKIIVVAMLIVTSFGAFAYTASPKVSVDYIQEKTKLKDGVTMKDGQMYLIKDGEMTEMLKAVIMSNGTKVLTNGEGFFKNGESFKLENGDVVYMNGKIEKKSP